MNAPNELGEHATNEPLDIFIHELSKMETPIVVCKNCSLFGCMYFLQHNRRIAVSSDILMEELFPTLREDTTYNDLLRESLISQTFERAEIKIEGHQYESIDSHKQDIENAAKKLIAKLGGFQESRSLNRQYSTQQKVESLVP